MILERVHRAGCMIVYRRSRKGETWVPLTRIRQSLGAVTE